MSNTFIDVERLTKKYAALWEGTTGDISKLKKYTYHEKRIFKKQIGQSVNAFTEQIKKAASQPDDRDRWKSELKGVLKRRAKVFLNIKNKEFGDIMLNDFTDVAETFTNAAKEFDNTIVMQDIAQAIRNVWIMNTIQVIASKKVEHTPSIFAYSMLYPCTDNFLDDPNVSKEDKRSFNDRLGKRLEGNDIAPESENEKKVYDLISMIESQYSREEYPGVFKSILSIHAGQCKSLDQQNKALNPSPEDILNISVEKGGTSVLADAYLVCGNLKDSLGDLMFGFGFVLQLIDDLQDAREDYDNDHMTVFSQYINKIKLDNLTSKLIAFTFTAMDFESYSESPYIEDIKELITTNTLFLVFEAIWENRKLYSRSFIKKYKKFSPYNFRYINKKMKKVKKEVGNLEELL